MINLGKIDENALDRSVLRVLKKQGVAGNSGVGNDAGVFGVSKDMCVSCAVWVGNDSFDAKIAVIKAINGLSAEGAIAEGITVSLTIPDTCEESFIKTSMEEIAGFLKVKGLEIFDGHTQISNAVTKAVFTVNAIGRKETKTAAASSGCEEGVEQVKAGDSIVMTKGAGILGTAILSKFKEKELLGRFNATYVEKMQGLKDLIDCSKDAEIALKSGAKCMHDVSCGGIYGALWELAKKIDRGIRIDGMKILILQETVECAEFFDVNPYTLLGDGAMLVVLPKDKTETLLKEYEINGIEAEIIGEVSDNNDKVVLFDEEQSFLTKNRTDSLWTAFK